MKLLDALTRRKFAFVNSFSKLKQRKIGRRWEEQHKRGHCDCGGLGGREGFDFFFSLFLFLFFFSFFLSSSLLLLLLCSFFFSLSDLFFVSLDFFVPLFFLNFFH